MLPDMFVLPPDVLPPDMLPAFVFIAGVGVLVGIGVDTFVVVLVFVAFPLFAFSLAQPAQKTVTASRAKRAKVLRIELSPVTQWVRLLRGCGENC
jgi:hypothetical protein